MTRIDRVSTCESASPRHLVALLLLALTAGVALAPTAHGALDRPGAQRSALNWRTCEGAPKVQCATLRVPTDWSEPRGSKISLALTRVRATDRAHKIGTVVFNCGGPGCPSAQTLKGTPNLFPARIHERFDVVGFDPRATGQSTPVRCSGPALDPSIPRFPVRDADYRRLLKFNRALARSCLKRTGDYLIHVGSPDVVRDMEAIRVALRGGKLNWIGISYGTMLGSEYAERYPGRIRTMVLDGALDRALTEPAMLSGEAWASEDSLERWAAWCTGSPECPLQGQDVLRRFDDLVASANRSPIPAAGTKRTVTGEEIQNTTQQTYLLFKRPIAFDPLSWLNIGPAIVKAENGDASGFATTTDYGPRAIECLEFPAEARTFADFFNRGRFAREVMPHLGGATETYRIISACVGWPRPPTDPRHFLRIKGAPPSLIVNSTHDNATSYQWALSMQDQYPGSVLLTREGDGHSSIFTSECAQNRISTYLISRALPKPGTVCPG